MTRTLSSRHLKLLNQLRMNSRNKLTEISKKTNIPVSTIFDMLKDLQPSLIKKNTVLLDFFELGYHTRAQIVLKVENEDKTRLKNYLKMQNNVNSIYRVNDSWDFIIETVHKNNKELDGFLNELGKEFRIKEQQIHYLIEDVKREEFIVPCK